MTRSLQYFSGFLAALAVALVFLWFSPYKNASYSIPGPGIYVDWYQDDSIWADLVHDVSGLSSSIRKADVLIIGNSKALYGLSAQVLNERFKEQGLRFFNLGLFGGEGVLGASLIINRLDLRQKILLVDIEQGMLSIYMSPGSRDAFQMDRFQAAMRVASVRTRAIGDTFLDRIGLPQLKPGQAERVLGPRIVPRGYRDMETGDAISAVRYDTPPGQYPLPPAPPDAMLGAHLLDTPHFRKNLENWKSRGMQLVFLTIPHGKGKLPNDYNPALAREAARRFGGEYIDLDWRLAMSSDQVHVDRESQKKLTASLADQLAEPSRAFAARALRLRTPQSRVD